MPPQKELDRTLKKVDEALHALALFRQRPEVAAGCGAKGKSAEELRHLLETLQRHHAELRRWMPQKSGNSKGKVQDARVRIEREMKRFQEVERVVKADSGWNRTPIKQCVIDQEEPESTEAAAAGENANVSKAYSASQPAEVKVGADQLLKEQAADREIIDEFICKICQVHVVGCGPKLARCSHLFCGDCIATWFDLHPGNQTWAQRAQAKGSVPCPVCKELLHEEHDLFAVTEDGGTESAFLWQMLSGLRIACANHPQCRADGECTWTGQYGDFQKHFQVCSNSPVIETAEVDVQEEEQEREESVATTPPPRETPKPSAARAPEVVPDSWDDESDDEAAAGAATASRAVSPPAQVADSWDDDLEESLALQGEAGPPRRGAR